MSEPGTTGLPVPPADPATMRGELPVQRDRYIDFLRAFSILVVVLWHWAFTILIWGPTGPRATSPLGFTSGLWVLTWLFQVLPLFFFVGGHVHLKAWQRAQVRGESLGRFVRRNIRKLSLPALVLAAVWTGLGVGLSAAFDVRWIGRAVLLVISPLWFIGIYLVLIALIPVWFALQRRFGAVVFVWMVGLVVIVDILRFRGGYEELAYLNMVLVWGIAFQVGFYYEALVRAHRQIDAALMWAGLFGLVGLVFSGLYPGSMVGVPGETSNMAPPTLCIVALLAFQVGAAEMARPRVERLLERPRPRRFVEVINRLAMPVFLFHTTGMAIGRGLIYTWNGELAEKQVPDLAWWLQRPLYIAVSLLCTLPVIWLFGRFGHRRPTSAAPRVSAA
ncbi:acyltransferase family protein [Pseudonocardia asaccharolytica]|uniref:Acyltransferase n=1 Tax=Pseudonocardia asaccharolytica DSM 44247 = NBRC 16224 TaxID=1123024 RepID=A0A511D3U8_9PSEU|nr:acyltransferase [Pseudonocardia asaccharolytica]GEL19462.1 acyltransferase [Pseudonocardia asaccharolytica DSM 44247 = NBRC 16224]